MGALEAARTAQRLSAAPVAIERRRPAHPAAPAPTPPTRTSFLETVFACSRLSYIMRSSVGSLTSFAQTYTGTISGTVKDPTGAVVPNAKVTVTDVGKGFSYNAQTDAGGIFTVRNLPPATYTERVEAPGFTPFERPNIVVTVNANVEIGRASCRERV